MWEFWKNRGGSTQIPLPFFTVFNMGDPQKINVPKVLKCKINHDFFLSKTWHSQTGGGEGGDLGKIPTFSRCIFLATSLRVASWLLGYSQLSGTFPNQPGQPSFIYWSVIGGGRKGFLVWFPDWQMQVEQSDYGFPLRCCFILSFNKKPVNSQHWPSIPPLDNEMQWFPTLDQNFYFAACGKSSR